jgi:hypothetical protein
MNGGSVDYQIKMVEIMLSIRKNKFHELCLKIWIYSSSRNEEQLQNLRYGSEKAGEPYMDSEERGSTLDAR